MAKNILKEAIADAKAVREVALANAKAALEEAFTPKLQSMLSAKLSEELDDEDKDLEDLEELVDYDVSDVKYGDDENETDLYEEESDLDEEIDLEEILNELGLEEIELEEGEDSDEETVDEDIDEEGKEDLDEMQVIYNAETANRAGYSADHVHENENFDLDSLLEELNRLDKKEIKKSSPIPTVRSTKNNRRLKENKTNQLQLTQSELNKTKSELVKTKSALTSVRRELTEVNLLNSKLLYVNRIFKSNTLDESQKLKVVENLDKAVSVKEAKLIYETIKDSFNISKNIKSKSLKRKSIREGLGMASKSSGTTQSVARNKAVLNESDGMVARFQKLANISIKQ